MNNTENQLEQLGRIYRQTKCPKSPAEIDQAVENAMASKRKPTRSGWYWAAAAAAIVAIAVPSALSLGGDNVKTVKIGDTEAYFCCNNDCDAESTIEMFNALIH